MRKYLLPSALVLLLGIGLALAQTINRAVQLSQDTTGSFSVDTNLGVYFPGHILSTTVGAVKPAPTVAGPATTSLTGTDVAGTVTSGTNATTATVTFGQAFVTVPSCVSGASSIVAATTNIALTFQPGTSGNKVSYVCMSPS